MNISNKKYDALLLHGNWLSEDSKGNTVLSVRSFLATEAAAICYRNFEGIKIVISAGKIWGDNYSSVAHFMERKLIEKHGIPKKDIIRSDDGIDTKEEVDLFLKLAQKNNWHNLLDIAFGTHMWIIPKLYGEDKKRIRFETIEGILTKHGTAEMKAKLRKIKKSKYEWNFRIYEFLLWISLFIDPSYSLPGIVAKKTRNKKIIPGGLPFLPVDK